MDIEKLKSWVPSIRAQLTEKAQLTESGTINIGGNHYHFHIHLPPGTDAKEIQEILSQRAEQISQEAIRNLEASQDDVASLPEKDRFQFVVNATAASISEALKTDKPNDAVRDSDEDDSEATYTSVAPTPEND